LIVGELDEEVLELNAESFGLLDCEKELQVIRGATHLFEEEGALLEVSRVAAGWFLEHLGRAVSSRFRR
jgi:hypothetical protein